MTLWESVDPCMRHTHSGLGIRLSPLDLGCLAPVKVVGRGATEYAPRSSLLRAHLSARYPACATDSVGHLAGQERVPRTGAEYNKVCGIDGLVMHRIFRKLLPARTGLVVPLYMGECILPMQSGEL